MTKVGIFGVAHVHAAAYVSNIAHSAGASLVGTSELDPTLRAAWADSHGVSPAESHEALVDGLDAAIICTTTADHIEVARLLASRGIPTLCEKPLATNLSDAREIVAMFDQAGTPLMTAFPMRFSPVLDGARTLIDDGSLGEVIAFTGQNQSHIPTDYAPWFADPVAAGGGAVMDHTVHVLDILRWWTGAEPVEVYAETNSVLHPEEHVETAGIVTVTFDNGVFATIDCSWSRPEGYPTWGGLEIEAVGTTGSFSVDAFADRLRMWSDSGETWEDWGADANQGMIDHFLGAVRGEHAVAVTGGDGLKATEVALAAYRSVDSGQPVRLDG